MAATCARFIAIQRQNTPRRHIPTPRQIHQTLDKSRFIFRLSAQSPEYAVSDEAAAYIADALMEIALQFEASHFAQIRRHYQSITPTRDDDPWQLDMFGKHPPS
jgi:hypothetical protein